MHLLTTVPRKLALPSFPTFTRILSPKRGPFLTLFHDLFFPTRLFLDLRLREIFSNRPTSTGFTHCGDWAAKSRIFRVDFSPRTKRE